MNEQEILFLLGSQCHCSGDAGPAKSWVSFVTVSAMGELGWCMGPKEDNVQPESLLGHFSKWVDLVGSRITAFPPECWWMFKCAVQRLPEKEGWVGHKGKTYGQELGNHRVLSPPPGSVCPELLTFFPADTPSFRSHAPSPDGITLRVSRPGETGVSSRSSSH